MEFKNPERDLFLIIDDEYDAFWAYLTNNNKIISDCWIANKTDIPLRKKNYYKEKKIPRPAKDEFIAKNIPFDMDDNISVNWNDRLEEVTLIINDEKCIKFSYSNNRGFSQHLKKNCPWGNKW